VGDEGGVCIVRATRMSCRGGEGRKWFGGGGVWVGGHAQRRNRGCVVVSGLRSALALFTRLDCGRMWLG